MQFWIIKKTIRLHLMWHKNSFGIEQDWLLSYVHKKHYILFSLTWLIYAQRSSRSFFWKTYLLGPARLLRVLDTCYNCMNYRWRWCLRPLKQISLFFLFLSTKFLSNEPFFFTVRYIEIIFMTFHKGMISLQFNISSIC